MAEEQAIRIPQEYVNDDSVKFLRWLVAEGSEVREGDSVAEVETSKAVVELAAAATGKIRFRAKPGEEVRVGAIVGYIFTNETALSDAAVQQAMETPTESSATAEHHPLNVRFSKKALGLIEAYKLSQTAFAGQGLVREQDVQAYLERSAAKRSVVNRRHFALERIPLDRISFPAGGEDPEIGKINPEFLSRLRTNPTAVAGLSSAEKCALYSKHGAAIGEGVRLGENSILIAPQIVLGDRVTIGKDGFVNCRERFAVGSLSSFRDDLLVRGGTVIMGVSIFGGSRVQIGGGGNGDPQSFLSVGDGTYLGDDIFVNICRPVLIGREVFLTQRSILVTHNIGHSVLEGYENRFAPIVLEDYAQVGMNSTIYAGVRVGAGSIVMSNSYVISSIPPGKLAAGVPARVIREATRPLDRGRQLEITCGMVREYQELLTLKGYACSQIAAQACGFEVRHHDKRYYLLFQEVPNLGELLNKGFDETVVWTFEPFSDVPPTGCTLMELLPKRILGASGIFAESAREFLRKRGIRLEPGPWRYSGGLI